MVLFRPLSKGVFLPFFNFDIKKGFLVLFLIILPLSFMPLDRFKTEKHFVFRSFAFVSAQMLSFYHSIAFSIKSTTDTYLNLIHTRKESHSLRKENKELKIRISLLQEKERENKRLGTLLKFQESQKTHFVPARVIGYDPLSKYQLITINRGYVHGVRKKMVALTEEGVVGYVFRALSHFSQVILLTDPNTALSALVERSRVQGVVEGQGGQFCKLKYLKSRDDVRTGDRILTSGLSLLTSKGLPIGQVTYVQKNGLTQDVTITPFVNPARLEEVLIALKKPTP